MFGDETRAPNGKRRAHFVVGLGGGEAMARYFIALGVQQATWSCQCDLRLPPGSAWVRGAYGLLPINTEAPLA